MLSENCKEKLAVFKIDSYDYMLLDILGTSFQTKELMSNQQKKLLVEVGVDRVTIYSAENLDYI